MTTGVEQTTFVKQWVIQITVLRCPRWFAYWSGTKSFHWVEEVEQAAYFEMYDHASRVIDSYGLLGSVRFVPWPKYDDETHTAAKRGCGVDSDLSGNHECRLSTEDEARVATNAGSTPVSRESLVPRLLDAPLAMRECPSCMRLCLVVRTRADGNVKPGSAMYCRHCRWSGSTRYGWLDGLVCVPEFWAERAPNPNADS